MEIILNKIPEIFIKEIKIPKIHKIQIMQNKMDKSFTNTFVS